MSGQRLQGCGQAHQDIWTSQDNHIRCEGGREGGRREGGREGGEKRGREGEREVEREREGGEENFVIFPINNAGLASFSTSSFISSSLDGSVQTFNLDTAASDCHVTPNPVTMATQGDGRGLRAQGVAVSETGIFAAVSVK